MSFSSDDDISYWGILRNGVPSILNNAAAPTALLLNLAIFSQVGGPEWMAAYAVVQSTVTFCQGMFNFLLYIPMASIAHAVGQKLHGGQQVIKMRVTFALLAGIVLGIICTVCLCWSILGWSCIVPLLGGDSIIDSSSSSSSSSTILVCDGTVLKIMNIANDIRPLVILYLWGRVPSILLVFVNNVCTGILVGKQRVRLVTSINVLTNILDVTGNAIVLLLRKKQQGNLYQAGLATSAATVVGTVLILPLAIYLAAPSNYNEEEEREHDNNTSVIHLSRESKEKDHTSFSVRDFIFSSLNMIARSVLLQGAMYLLSILSSRIGTSVLAAHQVVMQIWCLISLFCDGFADVGTMVGARLLGAGKHEQLLVLTNRLLVFAMVAGTVCGTILLLCQESIIEVFTTATEANDDTQTVLRSVWMLTALMQPLNALVFVSDGLLFAHQAFSFIRNLMFIGVLAIFVPLLWIGYSTKHTLLALWIAKSLLTSWRAIAAFCFFWGYQRKHYCGDSTDPGDKKVPITTERSVLLP
mmetsp:Transcript_9227/g.10750  ORF Transcript_9227/g.10750 Transcript_9227/m.10750 type:complete len:526 (-) Transcript_9227:1468-3045(-)